MLGELTRENLKQLDPAASGEEGEARPEGQTHDEIDSLYNLGSGVEEKTQVEGEGASVRTSKTVVSELQKQLNEEKRARERLEKELQEIKRISSEISSHLKGQATK